MFDVVAESAFFRDSAILHGLDVLAESPFSGLCDVSHTNLATERQSPDEKSETLTETDIYNLVRFFLDRQLPTGGVNVFASAAADVYNHASVF